MSDPVIIACARILGCVVVVVILVVFVAIRRKNAQLWLGPYICSSFQRQLPTFAERPIDVFIAICDHFEPEWGSASPVIAHGRVQRWVREYPKLAERFNDSSGRHPQHTFFFPQDQYRPEYLDLLSELCEAGLGDVDVHLHHDGDTPTALRDKLEEFRETLFHQHGLLRRDPETGEIVYGFIHGNWALCNSRPDGRWCGVNGEIPILLETGCYADFTLPSAPMPTQTRTINSIYYAFDRPGKPKSHNTGVRARVGRTPPDDGLLMVQGPLLLDWHVCLRGRFPRIENGDLHADRPPDWQRFQLWMNAGVCVAGKPEWRFVKLHTHGAKPGNDAMLLSPRMVDFHTGLAQQARMNPNFRYHYVSAWEMAQLVHQAERGENATPGTTPSEILLARH